MEGLKRDLRGIQTALKALVGKFESPLQVPSWRFPEKLSSSLNTDELLKSHGDSQVFLLELLVDRLLFMLQCCLHFSEQFTGRISAKPLTLASTVKTFSRKFTQDLFSIEQLKAELSKLEAELYEKDMALTKLQEQCQPLQEALDSGNSSTPILARKLPDSETEALKNADLAVACSDSDLLRLNSSSCLPYEAEGTLKINKLTLNSESKSLVQLGNTSVVDTSNRVGPSPKLIPNSSILPNVRNQVSVSVQTVDTAFALCAHCTATQLTLTGAATSLSKACARHCRGSEMAVVDWTSSAQVGGLELDRWTAAFHSDLEKFDTYCSEIELHNEQLVSERNQQTAIIADLQSEIEALMVETASLRSSTEDIQNNTEILLASNRKGYEEQIKQLEYIQTEHQVRIKKLEEVLESTSAQETHLTALVRDLEHQKGQLEQKLHRAQGQELQVQLAKQAMESELHCLRGQLGQCQQQLQETQVELNKRKEVYVVLNNEYKTLKAQHASVCANLDKKTQVYDKLYMEFLKGKQQSELLERTHKLLEDEYTSLQQILGTARSELADSTVEQEKLCGVISHLEKTLEQVEVELKQEGHRCRLLMDYPFIKQTSADYAAHIASLSSKESQKQVSANTIRILLLEEQNMELRERLVTMARDYHNSKSVPCQLRHPTPIWRNELLLQVNNEQKAARLAIAKASEKSQSQLNKAIVSSGTAAPVDPTKTSRSASDMNRSANNETATVASLSGTDLRSYSGTRFKGRLGHLVSAIAEVNQYNAAVTSATTQGLASSKSPVPLSPNGGHQTVDRFPLSCLDTSPGASYNSMEVHMCSKCDRMFHTVEDLKIHYTICTS